MPVVVVGHVAADHDDSVLDIALLEVRGETVAEIDQRRDDAVGRTARQRDTVLRGVAGRDRAVAPGPALNVERLESSVSRADVGQRIPRQFGGLAFALAAGHAIPHVDGASRWSQPTSLSKTEPIQAVMTGTWTDGLVTVPLDRDGYRELSDGFQQLVIRQTTNLFSRRSLSNSICGRRSRLAAGHRRSDRRPGSARDRRRLPRVVLRVPDVRVRSPRHPARAGDAAAGDLLDRGGKRWRAILFLVFVEGFDEDPAEYLPYACIPRYCTTGRSSSTTSRTGPRFDAANGRSIASMAAISHSMPATRCTSCR